MAWRMSPNILSSVPPSINDCNETRQGLNELIRVRHRSLGLVHSKGHWKTIAINDSFSISYYFHSHSRILCDASSFSVANSKCVESLACTIFFGGEIQTTFSISPAEIESLKLVHDNRQTIGKITAFA